MNISLLTVLVTLLLGILGFIVYFILFKEIIKNSKQKLGKDKVLIYSILIIMILSGFTETYIASIHYVVGPTLFCLINGIIYSNKKEKKLCLN